MTISTIDFVRYIALYFSIQGQKWHTDRASDWELGCACILSFQECQTTSAIQVKQEE